MDDSARISALEIKVADLERKLDFTLQHLNLAYQAAPLTPAQTAAANWLKQGNKIEAVKAYQQITGAGLRESKDAVDALEQMLRGG